jgi:hypothetical protein
LSEETSEKTHRWVAWLTVAGITLAAALGGVYGFRERLFRMAFERRSLPAMHFLLMMDPKLADSSSGQSGLSSSKFNAVAVGGFTYFEIACGNEDEKTALILAQYTNIFEYDTHGYGELSATWAIDLKMFSVLEILLKRAPDASFASLIATILLQNEEFEELNKIIFKYKIDIYYFWIELAFSDFGGDNEDNIKSKLNIYFKYIPKNFYSEDTADFQKALLVLRENEMEKVAELLEQAAREARAKRSVP